jgi:hypothetical protein
MLWTIQDGIERCDIINDTINGRLQTFLQLRDMEHVMHASQGWRQLQSVCHIPWHSQDREQADVTWCQLAFDPKPLHTSRSPVTKVHTIASFKLKWTTSLGGIAFLPSRSGFQVGLDAMDYLLGLSD